MMFSAHKYVTRLLSSTLPYLGESLPFIIHSHQHWNVNLFLCTFLVPLSPSPPSPLFLSSFSHVLYDESIVLLHCNCCRLEWLMPHCTACCSQSMMAGKEEERHATSWCSGLRWLFSFGFDTIEMKPNKTAEINQMNEPCQFSIMLLFYKANLSCCIYGNPFD